MSEVHRNGEQLLDQIEALLNQEECSKAAALAEGALTDGGLPREIRAELLRKKEIALFRLGRYAEALGTLHRAAAAAGQSWAQWSESHREDLNAIVAKYA